MFVTSVPKKALWALLPTPVQGWPLVFSQFAMEQPHIFSNPVFSLEFCSRLLTDKIFFSINVSHEI
jgi:hypothetical protein